MKKNYFTLLTLLLLSASPVISQQVFKKSFGGNDNSEYQYDFKKMKGDNYLVTGVTSDYGAGNTDAYCIMLNEQGDMLWSKTYGSISRENSTKCYGTADNGFLLAFNSYGGNTGKDTGLFIVKCDKKGNIEWSKLINNKEARTYRPASLHEDKKGNYYMLYDWNTSIYYGKIFTLIKMNHSGDILWNKVVNTEPLSTFTSIQIAEVNNEIIVGGFGLGDNWSTYGSFIHLFLFSKNDGSIKLCNIIKTNNCSYCDLYLSNIVVKNNHIYLAGTHYAKVGGRKIFWFEVDKIDGKITGKIKSYKTEADIQYLVNNKTIEQPPMGFSTHLIFLKDGSYMAANRDFTGYATYYDIVVYKYDSLGQTCNGNIPKVDTEIRDLNLHISDKSYTVLDNKITSKDYPLTVTNVTASRTLCIGEITGNSEVEKKETTSLSGLKPQLYPNPAADAIHITFEASKSSVISLGIFDATGKQVFTKTSYFTKGAQEVMLDIRSLKPGIYYIKIFDGDKPEMIKFIKQ